MLRVLVTGPYCSTATQNLLFLYLAKAEVITSTQCAYSIHGVMAVLIWPGWVASTYRGHLPARRSQMVMHRSINQAIFSNFTDTDQCATIN